MNLSSAPESVPPPRLHHKSRPTSQALHFSAGSSREAISLGGSSISDYVDADGEEGFFQLQHRVYGREAQPCLVCKTPIKRIVIPAAAATTAQSARNRQRFMVVLA